MCSFPLVAAEDHAPLPARLMTAKAVYLVNESGDLKAYDHFYKELKKWNRFNIVASRGEGEILMVLTTGSGSVVATGTAVSNGGVTTGFGAATPSPTLQLKILDAATAEVLWSDATDKWITGAGHASAKLVSNLKKRMPTR